MSTATLTAVVVPIPAAEPVVAGHRRRLDPAAGWGVPAHVTVVVPFAPPDALDDATVARLAAAVASVPRFECRFGSCRWFGEEVVWLAPEPAAPFVALTEAVVDAFPAHPPYGGAFDEVIPHLTVGESRCGGPEDLRAAAADVVRSLPFDSTVDPVQLIAGTDRPDSWSVLARLPLGAPGEPSGR